MSELLTFDRFIPGNRMGVYTLAIDDELLALWQKLYPHDTCDGQTLPAGFATVMMMRAYMQILSPRPPGNIHARQKLELHAPIFVGESITVEMTCASKELRRERRYVEIEVSAQGIDGRKIFSGLITLIWAA